MFRSLLKIRLSVLAPSFLIIFMVVVFTMHREELTSGQLALFSVNSFLFGYYFSPLLSAQKGRIASLRNTVRKEATTILDILTQAHLMASAKNRHTLKVKLKVYIDSIIGDTKINADNIYYDDLLLYTKRVKGEDASVMDTIYQQVCITQDNRDELNNQFSTRLYSHEWMVASVLFTITMYFALQTDFGDSIFFGILLAILLAALSLLMAIFIKYATLTHKYAKEMWRPLKDLEGGHFNDITATEAAEEKARIKKALVHSA